MTTDEIKKKLDQIDFQILKLLNTRMELDLKSNKLNMSIDNKVSESDVLEKIRLKSGALIAPQFCEKLFKEIIAESKKLQKQDLKLIGYQGEPGAYGQVAAKLWQKKLIPIPCSEFTQVFERTTSGLYDFGIVPVENRLGGTVSQVNQLILNTKLHVVGAVELPIHHCLLAQPGTDYRELRAVYSHYQALEQCHHFLARNNLEPIPYYDTAGAAKMLSENAPKATAAIASKLCADIYNLDIIKENIEDFEKNITRFLIFSRNENKEDGSKCSIVFSTEHKAGTLFKVLEQFAKENINLTRIESLPNQLGSFAFFLDFIGSKSDEHVYKVLEKIKSITVKFRLMGCYNEIKAA
jgi:prephenate dehydratase/chorismate mutase/prephenate dehydratase